MPTKSLSSASARPCLKDPDYRIPYPSDSENLLRPERVSSIRVSFCYSVVEKQKNQSDVARWLVGSVHVKFQAYLSLLRPCVF